MLRRGRPERRRLLRNHGCCCVRREPSRCCACTRKRVRRKSSSNCSSRRRRLCMRESWRGRPRARFSGGSLRIYRMRKNAVEKSFERARFQPCHFERINFLFLSAGGATFQAKAMPRLPRSKTFERCLYDTTEVVSSQSNFPAFFRNLFSRGLYQVGPHSRSDNEPTSLRSLALTRKAELRETKA